MFKEGKDGWLKVTNIHLPDIKYGMLHVEATFKKKWEMATLMSLSVTSLLRDYNLSIHLFTMVSPKHR